MLTTLVNAAGVFIRPVETTVHVVSSSWDGRPFGHNRCGPKRGWGLLSHFGGSGAGPNPTQCGWAKVCLHSLYQVASWSIQPFGHNRHGPKMGEGAVPLWGYLDPHITQCRLSWGLPPYQVASWSILALATVHGSNSGGLLFSLFWGSWVPI